jgi:hypothetical protein
MNRVWSFFSTSPPGRAVILALALALTSACLSGRRPDMQSHTSHWAVRAPGSLAIDVVEYTWSFINFGRHIRITGLARNNSNQAYQSVTLGLVLMDERGEAVLQGQALVFPAYLQPGAEGRFELVGMTASKGRNLPGGRLVVTARSSNL